MSFEIAGSLYARPTFLEGVGRIVDIGGWMSEYNYSANPEEADLTGSALDWLAVMVEINRAARIESAMSAQPALEM